MGYRLGVDLGTTFSAAAADDGSGPQMVGLGNRALQIPSVLFLLEDGTFLCGEAAERRGAVEPQRVVREFKRRIGDTVPILVAGQPFSPQALSAKLLTHVVAVATERQGAAPDEVVLTHPANWGGYKRELVDQVIALADLPAAVTCTEPEAAAIQYASRAGLAAGSRIAVYDLGGGTFDICVLEKQEVGFRILGSPEGIEQLGGIDFDEAVFQHVLASLGDEAGRLGFNDPTVTAALSRLRRDCVEAKEALSNDVEAAIPVNLPGVTTTIRLTRPELESLISPALRETLAATRRGLRSAATDADKLSAVVLVGGSSRIPLVSELLQQELGVRTAMDTHPKHDIALGAVQYASGSSQEAAPLPAATVSSAVVDWPSRELPDDRRERVPVVVAEQPTEEVPVQAAAPPPAAGPTGGGPTPAPAQPVAPPAPVTAAADPAPVGASPLSRLPAPLPLVLVAAALAVAGVIGAVLLLGGEDGSEPAAQNEQPPPVTVPSEPVTTPPGSPDASPTTPEPVVGLPENVLVVPIDTDGSGDLDLFRVDVARGGRSPVALGPDVPSSGDQLFPSVSPDRRTLVFLNSGQLLSLRLDQEGAPARPFFSPEQTGGLSCTGRAAWRPSGEVALACGPGGGRVVVIGQVGEDGLVVGERMSVVEGSGRDHARSITVTGDGHVVVTDEQGDDQGLYRIPVTGGSWQRLTIGSDRDAVAAPSGDDIAFQRDGDLYLVDPRGDTPCETAVAEPAGPFRLCRLTSTPEAEHHPVWSWDGARLAFLTGVSVEGLSALAVLDVSDPTDQRVLSDVLPMSPPAWARR